MDWSRDGRKKRMYTYVQTQRKYDVQFQRLYTYLDMQNCYELIPILPGRAGGGRYSSTKYDSTTGTTLYDKVLLTRCFGVPSWTGDAFSTTTKCHEVLRLSRKVTRQPHQILRLPHKMTLQPHQILHLPHKINVISGLRHIWKLISNAWSK